MSNTIEVELLVELLQDACNAYYGSSGDIILSDDEYDNKIELLRRLEPKHPFLANVGHTTEVTEWNEVDHEYPMGSQTKCKELRDYIKWSENYRCAKVLEEKLDGISISLTYDDGKLVCAATRKTGTRGENIYRNVVKMQGVPLEIEYKKHLVVRGEIVLKYKDFNALLANGLQLKTPRNACAGIAKRYDGVNSEYLSVICYDVMNKSDFKFSNELQFIDMLKSLNFATVATYKVDDIDDANKVYQQYITERRASLEYDIDGLVAKTFDIYDNSDDWEHPKNQIAWKFPPMRANSTIRQIINQVSGDVITPVAVIDPVMIGGVTINKASLHNYKLAEERNISIGAQVEVTRRNDVIPHIESVLVPGDGVSIKPTCCPVCKGDVGYDSNQRGEELAYLVCRNPLCTNKVRKIIEKWLDAHECKGLDTKTIDILFDNGIISDILDFLKLNDISKADEQHIINIDGMGQGKLNIIQSQIQKTLNTDIVSFLCGLGLGGIERKMLGKIEDYLLKTHKTINLTQFIEFVYSEELNNVVGYGFETINKLRSELTNKSKLIDHLLEIITVSDIVSQVKENILCGKTFCFTGELETMTRTEAQKLVKEYGGSCISSVSKKLNYLVTNDPNSGTTKNQKAQSLGIPIITEKEFLELIKYE
jgi:DNA ligase (NAD+)